jgi:peptidyl-dipeptidase Dcp
MIRKWTGFGFVSMIPIVGFQLLMHRDMCRPFRFYLEPDFRGLGLGKKLMELFMQFLFEKRYRATYLWTTNEQSNAISLYKKYGFVLTEEKDSSAFGKPLREQRYDLTIA